MDSGRYMHISLYVKWLKYYFTQVSDFRGSPTQSGAGYSEPQVFDDFQQGSPRQLQHAEGQQDYCKVFVGGLHYETTLGMMLYPRHCHCI